MRLIISMELILLIGLNAPFIFTGNVDGGFLKFVKKDNLVEIAYTKSSIIYDFKENNRLVVFLFQGVFMLHNSVFNGYVPYANAYDEIFTVDGKVRDDVRQVIKAIDELNLETLYEKQKFVDASFLKSGITFTVYSDSRGTETEKIFPFDLIPRIISEDEWRELERGLKQCLKALNFF